MWDSTAVGRWETLVKTVPAIVTRGSIIVERGKAHFKGPPLVECPRCKAKLTHGSKTLTFQCAPTATQRQLVEAWVCSCGEYFVPGAIAREAYLRAFQKSDSNPWMKFAGMFKDDPLVDGWKQAMADYRKEVDEDPDYL